MWRAETTETTSASVNTIFELLKTAQTWKSMAPAIMDLQLPEFLYPDVSGTAAFGTAGLMKVVVSRFEHGRTIEISILFPAGILSIALTVMQFKNRNAVRLEMGLDDISPSDTLKNISASIRRQIPLMILKIIENAEALDQDL